jgi:alanine-glyoxylate transaminase / serine-glyoxylate transaminase / serine-pyruvate transaminase
MVVSQRALLKCEKRKSPPTTYFGSFQKWLPIMKKYESRQPCYFATPPVQLILALHVSLQQFMLEGMEKRFALHREASQKFKNACKKLGFRAVPVRDECAANTLTALYYPDGVVGGDLLKQVTGQGVVIAGGLHPHHNTKYFRVGHMNVSATDLNNGHIDSVINALATGLKNLKK